MEKDALSQQAALKPCKKKPTDEEMLQVANRKNLVKAAKKSRPWDFGYLDDMIYYQLVMMRDYFKTSQIAVGDEQRYKEIRLAVNLMEILRGSKDCGHFEGREWITDIHLNFNNAGRYGIKEKDIPFFVKCPWNYYEMKARSIFYKYLALHVEDWWN